MLFGGKAVIVFLPVRWISRDIDLSDEFQGGRSAGRAKMLCNLQRRNSLLIRIIVGQLPTVLAAGAE